MQDENRFNVEAPSVAVPVEYIPTVAAEGQVTYAAVKFEDNSVNIWEKLSDQLPTFWKEVQKLKKEKAQLDFDKVKEKYRIHTFELSKAARAEQQARAEESRKVAEETRDAQQAIAITNQLKIDTDEKHRKNQTEANRLDAIRKGDHASAGNRYQNDGLSLRMRAQEGVIDMETYKTEMAALRTAMFEAARADKAYGGDVEAARNAFLRHQQDYLNWLEATEKLDEKEKEEQRRMMLENLITGSSLTFGDFILLNDPNTGNYGAQYYDGSGGN